MDLLAKILLAIWIAGAVVPRCAEGQAIEDAPSLLARGWSYLAAEDLDAMLQVYDRLLAQYPDFNEREKLAAGYAALGKKRLANYDLMAARDALQRALHLAPRAPSAPAVRAQLRFIGTELALTGPRPLTGRDHDGDARDPSAAIALVLVGWAILALVAGRRRLRRTIRSGLPPAACDTRWE